MYSVNTLQIRVYIARVAGLRGSRETERMLPRRGYSREKKVKSSWLVAFRAKVKSTYEAVSHQRLYVVVVVLRVSEMKIHIRVASPRADLHVLCSNRDYNTRKGHVMSCCSAAV